MLRLLREKFQFSLDQCDSYSWVRIFWELYHRLKKEKQAIFTFHIYLSIYIYSLGEAYMVNQREPGQSWGSCMYTGWRISPLIPKYIWMPVVAAPLEQKLPGSIHFKWQINVSICPLCLNKCSKPVWLHKLTPYLENNYCNNKSGF